MTEPATGPEAILALRRGAHTFLSRHARHYWTVRQAHGAEPPELPPHLEAAAARERLSAAQRNKVLGRDEARRLSQTEPYYLDAAATELAVGLGTAIRTAVHPAVVAAGNPDVVARMNISPPASFGFVRWATSVADTPDGAPVIACHWGRIPDGHWLVFWADNHIAAELMKVSTGMPRAMMKDYVKISGPLVYDYAAALGPRASASTEPSTEPSAGADDAAVDPEIALAYTLVGTWATLTVPGLADLTPCEPSRADALADRRAGMASSTVTHAAAADGALAELSDLLDTIVG